MSGPTPNTDMGKIYIVAGMARSGIAAARMLLSSGAIVRLTDTRTAGELAEQVNDLRDTTQQAPGRLELHLGGHPESILSGATALILSPGIPPAIPFVRRAAERGIPVWSEIELAFRHLRGQVVGITGSNGKSTTTALTAHLLRTAGRVAVAAGNIGAPLCDFIANDSPEAIHVTELSSFQLETIDRFHPRLGAILNITPDHLDRYADMEAYAGAKWNLFRRMDAADAAILNARDRRLVEGSARVSCRTWFFDSRPATSVEHISGAGLVGDEIWIAAGQAPRLLMNAGEIPLPGIHNLENVMAAALMATLSGAEIADIAAGVRSFKGLPHRLEPVAEIDGRSFYNDSKATNVDSTVLALGAFHRPIVLILGGKDKGGDYAPLRDPISRGVRHCLLIGAAADIIEKAINGTVPISRCRDMGEAVRRGLELSSPGDVILLAPACASFDMYTNFEHRGEVFRREVLNLKKEVDG